MENTRGTKRSESFPPSWTANSFPACPWAGAKPVLFHPLCCAALQLCCPRAQVSMAQLQGQGRGCAVPVSPAWHRHTGLWVPLVSRRLLSCRALGHLPEGAGAGQVQAAGRAVSPEPVAVTLLGLCLHACPCACSVSWHPFRAKGAFVGRFAQQC